MCPWRKCWSRSSRGHIGCKTTSSQSWLYSLVADGMVRCNSSHRTGGQQQRRQKIEQSRALAGRERMRIIWKCKTEDGDPETARHTSWSLLYTGRRIESRSTTWAIVGQGQGLCSVVWIVLRLGLVSWLVSVWVWLRYLQYLFTK